MRILDTSKGAMPHARANFIILGTRQLDPHNDSLPMTDPSKGGQRG